MSSTRLLPALGLAGVIWQPAFVMELRAAQPVAADEQVISLPPLIVEESDRALAWRYGARPGFEVLSVCDDVTTIQFEERQMRLAALMALVLPDRFQAHLAVPEAIVLFNEETGRARSRELVAEMVRKAGAQVSAGGVVRVTGPATSPAAALVKGPAPPQIQFLPNMRLAEPDAVRVFAILDGTGAHWMDFMFSPDRVAFLLARRTPALPDWFMVGMLGVYGRLWFADNQVEYRPLVWLSEEESSALAHDAERPRTLLPMQEIFTRRPVSDGGPPKTEREQIWQTQCALFVRWALSEPTGERREALWRWVDRLDVSAPTEDAFRECFGCGFADMRDQLSDYLPLAVANTVVVKGPKPTPPIDLKLRAANEVEIAAIRGDWERLEIAQVRQRYPALTDRYIDQARHTLHRAYDRGARDPRLLAVMGLTECDAGNPAAARPFLEAAVRGGVIRPRVYVELARLRYQEIAGNDSAHPFTPEETRRVMGLLHQAHRIAPPMAEVYALAGRVWALSAGPATEDDLAMMREGVRLFPSVPGIVLGAINLHVTRGFPGLAQVLAHAGAQSARDAASRDRFVRLEAELSATAK